MQTDHKSAESMMTPKERVEVLEQAVLENDPAKVRDILKGGTPEFTARALGLACMYADVAVVKELVEAGVTFDFEFSRELCKKYGAGFQDSYSYIPANYSLMLVKIVADAVIPERNVSIRRFHCGVLPETNRRENSASVRTEIADYLIGKGSSGFDSSEAMFYAIMWGDTKLAEHLIRKGTAMPETHWYSLSSTENTHHRKELLFALKKLPAQECLYALKTLSKIMEQSGKRLRLNPRMILNGGPFWDKEVLSYVMECMDIGTISKTKLIQRMIRHSDTDALEAAEQAGLLADPTRRDRIIAYATDINETEALAWLLDFKNRTTDPEKEEARERRRILRQLSAKPKEKTQHQKDWSYKKLEDGTVRINRYNGDAPDVIVPSSIDDSPVTSLRNRVFAEAMSKPVWARGSGLLHSVVIPERITVIPERAFYNCDNLQNVVLPEQLVEIGERAFLGCCSLEKLKLPEALKRIGEKAFRYCNKLKDLSLPESIDVEGDAFEGCISLLDSNGMFIQNDVLYTCDLMSFGQTRPAVIVPEGVREINKGAFLHFRVLSALQLPESLQIVGDRAFRGIWIQEIKFPSGLKTIGNDAFYWTRLKSLCLPEGLEMIGDSAFEHIRAERIRIPESVRVIGTRAFCQCRNLKDLYISANTTELGEWLIGSTDPIGDFSPEGVTVHTPAGSAAEKYMERYPQVSVVHDY